MIQWKNRNYNKIRLQEWLQKLQTSDESNSLAPGPLLQPYFANFPRNPPRIPASKNRMSRNRMAGAFHAFVPPMNRVIAWVKELRTASGDKDLFKERFVQKVHKLLAITSVHKDRKELSGRKSWTRETDDAVISAWMTESYDRDLPWYRAVGQNEQKSSKHDLSIHPDCIPGHRAAEKHLNFVLMAFQPGRSKLAMMDFQIVQEQEHLLFWNANQTLHKSNQTLLVHGALIDHKTNLALTADCGEHIDPLPLCFHRQHGRTDFWGKAALYDFFHRVWQNNMCKHYSTETSYRTKKCWNLLEHKIFQHNICMCSTKCEYRCYAGKC